MVERFIAFLLSKPAFGKESRASIAELRQGIPLFLNGTLIWTELRSNGHFCSYTTQEFTYAT